MIIDKEKHTIAYGRCCRNVWFVKTTGFLLKGTNHQAQFCKHVSLQMSTAAADYESIQLAMSLSALEVVGSACKTSCATKSNQDNLKKKKKETQKRMQLKHDIFIQRDLVITWHTGPPRDRTDTFWQRSV